ncbi:MAG: hypothetical protein COW48_05215 [Hydrogenophilales bacterium CG17_big_fil_post_rev_8_21_14_2_50_63_12]|nr:MAG: hypothetical protein COW48_05215 [Hydrogenophilales bacterium CG17_big_fil_post_rev_8_21_14_2_50_63_12]
MEPPIAYLNIVLPLIESARGFLENGESLEPFAFIGNHATQQIVPILIDTQTDGSKDRSVQLIKAAAEQTQADFVFTVMEAWGLPKDKMHRYEEIMDKCGSIGASPYKVDTAAFMLETRYGVWGCQMTLKPKGYSKKKRTFGKVELQFMDGVEGRFVGLLPGSSSQPLH